MAPPPRDAVHRHFTYDAATNSSMCNLCGKKSKGKHTSNLKAHLAALHPDTHKEVIQINKISKESTGAAQKTKADDIAADLKKICIQLVTVCGRPFALISDEPFQRLLSLAHGNPKDINEKNIKAAVPEVAYDIKMKIAAEIRNKLISLKVDSATCMERSFIGINIQYIKNDQIIVRNLAVAEVYERQTGEYLKQKLLDVLSDFFIQKEQVYSVTTDNGANMKKMTKLLGGDFCTSITMTTTVETEPSDNIEEESEAESENVEYGEENLIGLSQELPTTEYEMFQNILNDEENGFKVRGMLCAAHTLQLVVKDAIQGNVEVQAAIDLARKVSKILRKPTNRNLLKLANLKMPIIDCPTRWMSQYNMLERLLELKEFSAIVSDIAVLLSSEFWTEIEKIVTCLKPFKECTLILQKEQLTIGDFFIHWMRCKAEIEKNHNYFATSLLEALQAREKALMEIDVVVEGLYLDGRLNLILTQEQCQKARLLLNQTYRQIKKISEQQNYLPEEHPTNQSEPSPTAPQSPDSLSAIEAMLRMAERERGHTTTVSSFNACLHDLINIPRLPLQTNIIRHWSNKSPVNSDMTSVALTVLATPTTQVSVERLFSSLKFILSPLRNNINSILLEKMLFIRSNKDLM